MGYENRNIRLLMENSDLFFKYQKSMIKRALLDVVYHREKFYRDHKGNPVPFMPPQAEAARRIQAHILGGEGRTMCVRITRQFGKNEIDGTLQAHFLERFKNEPVTIIRTAPSYKPQVVINKTRFHQVAAQDLLFDEGKLKCTEGNIFKYGRASIMFLSTDPAANVEGATASLYMSVDEAHKVDYSYFEERFGPMAAFRNVPTVCYGVAASKCDLLYLNRQSNIDRGMGNLNIDIPADMACEFRPEYAAFYSEKLKKLGEDHPVIKTQYKLEDIDAIGGYLNEHHRSSILDSDHQRMDSPRAGVEYLCCIDLAGESEEEIDDPMAMTTASRDSTVAWIIEIDYSKTKNDIPMFRIVDGYWWIGKQMSEGGGIMGQQEILLNMLNKWRPAVCVGDARGIGEQLMGWLKRHSLHTRVIAYKADTTSVSMDCYGLLGIINNGQLKIWRDDNSPIYREFCRQMRHTKYEIRENDRMRICKPGDIQGQVGSGDQHIDMIKACTYIARYFKVKPFDGQHRSQMLSANKSRIVANPRIIANLDDIVSEIDF
jgi:hypothetical protein